MANKNVLCIYDFETGGKYPNRSQVTSLSCVMVDPVRLEILRNGTFDTLVRPIFDEAECAKLGLEPLQQEAMDVTGIKIEDLEKAPSEKEAIDRFVAHLEKFSSGTGAWGKPIPCGFNIISFDNVIMSRLAKKYGYWDNDREQQNIFHCRDNLDVMHIIWKIFENDRSVWSISFDNCRKYLGLSSEGAHSSLVDCEQVAAFLIRYLKWFRSTVPKMKLKDSMKGINIQDFYDIPS